MFERFTDRARKVLAAATQDAKAYNHEYICTEHLLLGVTKDVENMGCHILIECGVDIDLLRSKIKSRMQRGDAPVNFMGKLPQTPMAKNVIEYAIAEARALHHNWVGTEHILLGLLLERKGMAATTLVDMGADLDQIRQNAINILTDVHSVISGNPESREPVKWLASLMEKKLTKNDWKGHWKGLTPFQLLCRLNEELGELGNALSKGGDVIDECVDVANIAMMIADNHRKIN